MVTATPSQSASGVAKRIAIGILVVIVLLSSFTVVPAGHRGVIFNLFTGVQPGAFNEGLSLKIPFVQSVIDMEIRTQKREVDAASASADLQTVSSTIAVNYNLPETTVSTLYQEVGLAYEARIIDPAIQETVKAITARYTAEELITKRQLVRDEMKDELRTRLAQTNIHVTDFNIVNFDFSEQFDHAIEAKVTAEQQALKAERDLERIKIEAEQKITQATAEAEALKIQRQQVTPELIRLREVENQKLAIEKWDGVMPSVVAATDEGVLPMLPLQGVSATN